MHSSIPYGQKTLKNVQLIQFKKTGAVIFLTVMVMAVGCKKDYYTDTGLHTPNFNGTVLQYLQSKPGYFDSVLKVIQFSGYGRCF